MRFNSYFIALEHREAAFTGNLMIDGEPVYTNFKKIGDNIFIAFFKSQVGLKHLQELEFKNKNKRASVLFPVISKYNKRKLTKIAKILDKHGTADKNDLIINFLKVDKILRAGDLLYFFSESKEEMTRQLIRHELEQHIKIIDFLNLSIISYKNLQEYREELKSILNDFVVSRDKAAKLPEIESRLKLPRSSIFFKYLLHSIDEGFSFRIVKDKVVFRSLKLTEKENEIISEIENVIKKDKTPIFTIDNLLKSTDLNYKEINDSLWYLVDTGQVVQLNKKYYIFNEDLNKIINKLKKYKRNQGEMININSFRELTAYSRKYIITLFEYFDSRHITTRIENERKILLIV